MSTKREINELVEATAGPGGIGAHSRVGDHSLA
jgi:hypothetical protein